MHLHLLHHTPSSEILRASDLTVVSTKQIRQQLESEYNMSLKPFKKQLDALVMDTLEEVMSDKNNNGAKDDTDTDADANQSATMEDLFGEDQVSFPDDGNGTTTTVSDQDLAPAVSNSQNVPNYAQSLGLALPPTSFATQTLHTPSLAKATTSTTNTKRPKKSKDVISSSDSDLSSTEDLVPRSKKLRTDGAAAAGGKARKKGPDTDAEMARKLHSEVNGLRRARGDAKGAIILKKKKRATAAEAEDKADKPKRNTGLSKPMQLSPALGELLGAAEVS